MRDDTDDFRIDISHPTECVGFSCTLYKKDYIDEHCLLFMKDFKSGYDAFYTLKPKSWKKDLIRLYHEKLEHVESYHQKVLSLYDSNINIILNAEDKINQYI